MQNIKKSHLNYAKKAMIISVTFAIKRKEEIGWQMAGKTFKINEICPMCPYIFLGLAGSDAKDRAGRPPAFSLRNRLSIRFSSDRRYNYGL